MKKLEAVAYKPYGPHLTECLNLYLFLLPGAEMNTTCVEIYASISCVISALASNDLVIYRDTHCYYYYLLLLRATNLYYLLFCSSKCNIQMGQGICSDQIIHLVCNIVSSMMLIIDVLAIDTCYQYLHFLTSISQCLLLLLATNLLHFLTYIMYIRVLLMYTRVVLIRSFYMYNRVLLVTVYHVYQGCIDDCM